MLHILKCPKCKNYTLHEKCKCNGKALTVKPAKYSPVDNYGKYRRVARKKELKQKGML
ncbi:ribosome biogenesis protein [Candidatus Woesearchaeota archaeon]|nr:ribosome biogenesis protein [Candidatus Woesearchaeota archaeon]